MKQNNSNSTERHDDYSKCEVLWGDRLRCMSSTCHHATQHRAARGAFLTSSCALGAMLPRGKVEAQHL